MAKERRVQMMPPASLEARAGDVVLTAERYLKLSFFNQLKRKPSLERYPETLRLRRFAREDAICRQGEGGWTAFYALTEEDVAALLQEGLLGPVPEAPAPPGLVATVHLALARPPEPRSRGLLGWLGLQGPPGRARPKYIPIDAPRGAEYESKQAPLYAGELFGEMSCMSGSPRSGTIVAERDCYMLEMLRNILTEVKKDPDYQKQADLVYRARSLKDQVRELALFSELGQDELGHLCDEVRLVSYKVGEAIFDEHESSDGMYFVRSGLVKTVLNAAQALASAEVLDWPGLAARLRAGEEDKTGPLGQVWLNLSAAARGHVEQGEGPRDEGEKAEVLRGLHEFIRSPALPDAKLDKVGQEKALPASEPLRKHLRGLEKDPKKWADQERRRFGRLLLEALCPGLLRPSPERGGQECVLSYQSRGDILGEIGLLTGKPRSATCIAYAHPEPGQGHEAIKADKWRDSEAIVELAYVPRPSFDELRAKSKAFDEKVREVAGARQKRDAARRGAPGAQEGPDVSRSSEFQKLGLIQGQKLMLIDLDRCTRCDECVKACVDTHADGRSRLFLDGPRFGKYLVPTTCRSCLDPVCLIGCPVGSIHRGDNREIVVEDWCIGCDMCATNCPYGSIQMHDVGIVPQSAYGWRYALASEAGGGWMERGYRDRGWRSGRSPFRNDRDFRAALPAEWDGGPLCFRYAFELPDGVFRSASEFGLEVTSATLEKPPQVWINGREIGEHPHVRQGKRSYSLPREGGPLRSGGNVLAIRVVPSGKELEVLLDVRLDEVRQPIVLPNVTGDVKVVTDLAVVCDLCSGQYGQRPACVTACPHDAAMRVNARGEFPTG